MVMLTLLFYQIEMFLLIMAILVVLIGVLHTVSVFRFKRGKIFSSDVSLATFCVALSYIITIIICGM